jgi:uncharacterized NAD(P)/FAD-binding protein YdhS
MTKTQALLVDLRLAREGWIETIARIFRLQEIDDELVDKLWAQLSEVEQRELGRHLDSIWRKHKNKNLEYTFALLNKSIAILEARR